MPDDLENIAGFSAEADLAVDKNSKKFRIQNILIPLIERFGLDQYMVVTSKTRLKPDNQYFTYPDESCHHNAYYRAPNSSVGNRHTFTSSFFAKQAIKDLIQAKKPIVTITFRFYEFDKERNSNLHEWRRFVEAIIDDYDVVLIPDTDNPNRETYLLDGENSKDDIFRKCLFFTPAAFNFDIRLALYEAARMNMFVNNGPCVAATLSEKVRVPNVQNDSAIYTTLYRRFLTDAGYVIGENPSYLSDGQTYTWLNDDFESLISSFKAFEGTN